MSDKDLVRDAYRRYDAPEPEVEWTPLVGIDVPALEPAPPVAPELTPVVRRAPPPPAAEEQPAEQAPPAPPELPQHWWDLRAVAAEPVTPQGVPPVSTPGALDRLKDLDRWSLGALAVAVALVRFPLVAALLAAGLALAGLVRRGRSRLLLAALAVAGLELVVGGVLTAARVHDDRARERTEATLTAHLEAAGRVQSIVHTYEGVYAGPVLLARYGFATPTDSGFTVTRVSRFDYCMTARQGDVALTLRNGGTVSRRPC